MACTKDDLATIYELEPGQVDAIIEVIGFTAKKKKFSDAEEEQFKIVNAYFTESRVETYEQAKELYQQEQQQPQEQTPVEPILMPDMLKEAQAIAPVTLSAAVEILQACGLSEQPSYIPEEAGKFYKAVKLILIQGQTLADVAVHFNTNQNPLHAVASNIKQTGDQIVFSMVDHAAQGAASSVVPLLAQQLATHMGSDQRTQELQTLTVELQEHLGNGPAPLKGAEPLPLQPQQQNTLPEASENG